MREEYRDSVQVVYRDGDVVRRCRGIQVIDKDPVFIVLLRGNGDIIRFNKNCVEKIEEIHP